MVCGDDLKIIDILYRDTLAHLSTASLERRVSRDVDQLFQVLDRLLISAGKGAAKTRAAMHSRERDFDAILRAYRDDMA